jgi:hypothetical protein
MATKQDDGFSTRAILCLVNDLVAAEAYVARVGVQVRVLAKEHGIKMQAPNQVLVD